VLRRLVDTDPAQGCEEVALVPHSSPISQSGLLFCNTLLMRTPPATARIGYAFTLQDGDR
jgi:aminopeptidase